MDKFNLLKEIAIKRELRNLSLLKIVMSTLSLAIKYLMLVYLFDKVLDSISRSGEYSDFLVIVFLNAGCVILRLFIQNTEKYYLNDALKLSLESFFAGKLFQLFRMETIHITGENKRENEFKVNFIKENTYLVIDNSGLVIANMVLALLTFSYVTKFSCLYLTVIVFPLMSILVNKIIAEIEIRISKNEAGVLQVSREMKQITDYRDYLNYFCSFSLYAVFQQYKNHEFEDSIRFNYVNRRKMCFCGLVSSLFRVCAVFFAAVLISIKLLESGALSATDVVVIISACHMMAGAVSVIVSKVTQNSELSKTINSIFNEYIKKDVFEIDEEIYGLKLVDVTYQYSGNGKVMKYNVNIGRGDKVVITGNNGCGKTTLLKMILGYIEPESGEIFVNNKLIQKHYHIKTAASVFEPYPLLNVSAEKYMVGDVGNIMLAAEHRQMLHDLGVDTGEKLNFGSHLSAGTKQALNLIRIIYSRKTFIILDEPTSKLNPKLALPLIQKILSKDAVVMISTHDENVISLFENNKIIRLDGSGDHREGSMA